MSPSPGLVARFLRLAFSTMLFGAILFLAAGTLAWPAAWGYLALMTGVMAVYVTIVTRVHPDLIDERHHPPTDAKTWDKPFVVVIGMVGPVVLILLSGFDRRWQWSPPTPAWVHVLGLILIAAGGSLTNYAVAANRFFSALVRIQRDRGHQVVDSGPYRFVRHPGYAGSVLYMIGVAVALGSRITLLAAIVLVVVLAVRTALEDRTLQAELDGYAEYTRKVRFRLVPGLW